MLLNDSHDTEYEERFYECLECDEAVSNPLCPNCLKQEVEAWLTNYPSLGRKLLPELNQYIQKLEKIKNKSVICIHCNNKATSLCPYCFSKYVLDKLNELKINKQIIKEFLQFFNYDFGHTDYIETIEKEEELGLI